MLLAALEESHGQWQGAQQHYQKVLDLQPDNPIAANNLAYLLLQHSGNADRALSLAQTARRGLPDRANTAATLASPYIHNAPYTPAITSLQTPTNTQPTN